MLLLDLSHTSHTRARTGIQRVARQLYAALGSSNSGTAICFDPWQRAWRTLDLWEKQNLSAQNGAAASRGARWPWPARLRGLLRRRLKTQPSAFCPQPAASSLLVPEIFSPGVAKALPSLFARLSGPRAAIFHDAIALRLPELAPAKTIARFPGYLRELLAFDGIAAVSEDSRQSLLDYWRWLGVTNPPPVLTIPLGLGLPAAANKNQLSTFNSQLPTVLSVGSVEGRKNQVALLDACEQLWRSGLKFQLHLVGLSHPQTGRAALDQIAVLKVAGRPLRYDGPVDDAAVSAAYRACQFTVYPSLMEGFGLPVLESLAYGKPCLCSNRGALGEAARGGGCIALDSVDTISLAAAIRRLLENSADLAELAAAARTRTFKSWPDYTTEIISWLSALPRRR